MLKKFWKMIRDPRKIPDRHQNLINPTAPEHLMKIKNPFISFGDIPSTSQTNIQGR